MAISSGAKRTAGSPESCAGSGSPPISRPAVSRRPKPSARLAPAWACGSWPKCGSIPVGTVEVLTGSHSHGQGHETTFAQLVSQRLGIPLEQISIVHGDTDKVQMGMGSYGSRSGAVGMTAVDRSARQGHRQGEENCRTLHGGGGRQRRFPRRCVLRARHEQDHDVERTRAAGLCRAQIRHGGDRAGSERRRVPRSEEFHLPGGRAHRRSRDRSGNGQ